MKYQKLDSVLDLIIDRRGLTAKKLSGTWKNEGVPVISANNIRYGQFVDMDSLKFIDDKLYKRWMPEDLKKGDVLVVSEGATFGEILYLQSDLRAALGQRLFALRCKNDYDSRFLYYYLKSKRGQYELFSRTTGTSVIGIRQTELKKISVPEIKIDEQRNIAEILGSIDNKISVNKKVNKVIEEIGNLLFNRWFINFEFPNEENKSYKSNSGEFSYSHKLNKEIPNGWNVKNLGSYIEIINGISYASKDIKESDIGLVTLKCIKKGGGFSEEGIKPYVGKYKDSQIIRPGEVVVSHTDLTQKAEVLGQPALVRRNSKYKILLPSLDLCIVRPEKDFIKNFYLYYLLNTDRFHHHARAYANGTTVLHLNKKAIPNFIFPLPPKKLVLEFDSINTIIFEKIQNNENEMKILSNLRDDLLPKLMSGKIKAKVPEVEAKP